MPRRRFLVPALVAAALFGVYALATSGRRGHDASAERAIDAEQDAAPYRLTFSPTAALHLDPALARRVDELARQPRIEAKEVGEDGARSKVWQLYREISDGASREQTIALLGHESVVVRGYFAGQVLEELPGALESVYPLFADGTQVSSRFGCTGQQESLASHLVGLLAYRRNVADRASLTARIAKDGRLVAEARASALHLLVLADSRAARVTALALRSDAQPAVQRAAVRALGELGNPEDLELVAPALRSTEADERANALRGLQTSGSARAAELVEPLLDDPEAAVRDLACRAYGGNPHAKPERLGALLAPDQDDDRVRSTASGLAARDSEDALALLEPRLMKDATIATSEIEQLLSRMGPSALPRVRRLVGSADVRVRAPALATLGRLGDRVSLPAIRAVLPAGEIAELEEAAKIVADWSDVDAVPALITRLRDANDNVRIAAARALVRLHARQAIPALDAAVAERRGTWSEKELSAALTELRAL